MRSHLCFIISFLLIFVELSPICADADNSNNNTSSSVNTQSRFSTVSGVTDDEIRLGSVLPLDGRSAGVGQAMQLGLSDALEGQSVGDRRVHILYEDDLYEPMLTSLKVNRLLKQGIFAMIGNVGTPTAAVTLPILKQVGIPAVGFFTGSGLLRPGNGMAINYRASYAQETSAVINAAITAGIRPEQICAYVQNDAYGKSGLMGMQEALQLAKAPQLVLDGLHTLLANSTPDWLVVPTGLGTPVNENGPVGVYTRNQQEVMPGYKALKGWEHKTSYRCALVVTLGTYDNLAVFVRTVHSLGERWIISAVSFTGADNLSQALKEFHTATTSTDSSAASMPPNIIMSQVVPALESDLPIVQEAHNILSENFNFISLEGYIVGKMMLELLRDTPAPLTRTAFMNQAKLAHFDLEGIPIDFTRDGYQGSNLVNLTRLTDSGYRPLNAEDWREMLIWHNAKASSADTTAEQLSDKKALTSHTSKKRKVGKK